MALVGFDCYVDNAKAVIATDGTLLYLNTFEWLLRSFGCDGCPDWLPEMEYPDDVLDNDLVLDTPPCNPDDEHLSQFWTNPTGQRIHRCYWETYWDEAGQALAALDGPSSYGADDQVLSWPNLVDIYTGEVVPIVGPAHDSELLTSRADPAGGFWMALELDEESTLWQVDGSGVATLMGVYPAVPQGIEIPAFIDPEDGRERMDNSGGLFELAGGVDSPILAVDGAVKSHEFPRQLAEPQLDTLHVGRPRRWDDLQDQGPPLPAHADRGIGQAVAVQHGPRGHGGVALQRLAHGLTCGGSDDGVLDLGGEVAQLPAPLRTTPITLGMGQATALSSLSKKPVSKLPMRSSSTPPAFT
jgi:hypothetical protein